MEQNIMIGAVRMEQSLTTVCADLPANIDDLSKFVLVGREKLVAVRAEIRAIDKVGLAQEVREQKLKEAQDIADAVLDAEVRIGELMSRVPKATPNNNPFHEIDPRDNFVIPKSEVIEQTGFTQTQVSQFQRMAAHPEAVARAKAQARESGDILSRSKVLQEVGKDIRASQKAERIEKASGGGQSVDIFTTDKKYRVVYADPPWSYNDKQDTDYYGGAEKHYGTMPLEEIAALPVGNIAEKDAVLFLWTTSPLIFDSKQIFEAWGFTYKSMFVWDKVKTGMGHYNSVRHELLLICTRGSCTPDTPKMFDSVQSIERSENHSEKPQQFREIIETLYAGDKIELFARTKRDGWDVWGNEV
jgi:N6-adenosine-specific RNA methylase IME4